MLGGGECYIIFPTRTLIWNKSAVWIGDDLPPFCLCSFRFQASKTCWGKSLPWLSMMQGRAESWCLSYRQWHFATRRCVADFITTMGDAEHLARSWFSPLVWWKWSYFDTALSTLFSTKVRDYGFPVYHTFSLRYHCRINQPVRSIFNQNRQWNKHSYCTVSIRLLKRYWLWRRSGVEENRR